MTSRKLTDLDLLASLEDGDVLYVVRASEAEADRSRGILASTVRQYLTGGASTTATLRGGVSADATPEASELTITGAAGVLSFASINNERLLIARLASEGDITSVVYSFDATRTNQIGGLTKFGSVVDVGGADYAVWVSNQALTFASAFTAAVS